jgi:uncharacterized protein (DUF58 family)
MSTLLQKGRDFLQQQLTQRAAQSSGAIRLDRRSVFILPSSAGIAFVLSLLLMLLVAINYQNSLAYALCFLSGSVAMVAMVHTWRNLAGVSIEALASAPIFVGDQAEFCLRLTADRRLPHALLLGWSKQPMQPCELSSTGLVSLHKPALQRGWLKAEVIRLESRFPLGIFVAWSLLDSEQKVLVYPQPLPGFPAQRTDLGEGTASRQQGLGDYQGVRSWQPGESLRRMDWKAYSRGRGLLVKDFVAQAGADSLLDFDALSGDTEHRLSLLCHEVVRMTQQRQTFSLHLPGQQIGPDAGQAHSEACLRALALYALEPSP